MLKGIHPLLNGELLAVLAEMGHGDELALVDANFPATSLARRLVRLDAVDLPGAAQAILTLLPLDSFVDCPVLRMEVVGDPEQLPAVQQEVLSLASAAEQRPIAARGLERFAFYERCRRAFAVVATGERRLYGDILLVKGIIAPAP